MDLILYRAGAGIARIILNRPEKRNALNAEMAAGLRDALQRSAADEAVRVVLISGAGKDFCAGMDLLALDRGNAASAVEHLETARKLAEVLLAIRKHPHPVVAAVQGRALGGGAGIASACDLVLAAESACFGYPEVKIGFVPAMVAALLRRSVTEKRMFELLASGESVSADEAHAIGLINRVLSDEDFAASVDAYVQGLAEKSATALTLLKNLLYQTDGMTLEKAIEAGAQVNALSRTTEDAKRGFAGFTKKS
ncbi:MAG: enoyl-CoA hydratase/isomerase family protein [Bryobacterales bacterium]|nr:enoyl-CoA hydratase/isomerase family protein [Bryobacterales bacterium]